jgi:ElaB/YqjD/DUF883 family membrane-anchored ribosome-binding protein
MSFDKSTVRPGLLVSLKTELVGNVNYAKNIIESEREDGAGGTLAKWETERHIQNAAEHEEAVKVRGKCRSMIIGVCAKSSFGLLCPKDREPLLRQAVEEAARLADNFNAVSELSKIVVRVLTGEFVDNEVEAVKALNEEVRGLINSMEQGIKRLDVDAVRDAANRAKNLGSMLSEEANEKLEEAIKAARKVARAIVKQGEVAVGEIDQVTLAALADARTAFLDLDLDEVPEVSETAPAEVADVEVGEPMNGISEEEIDLPPGFEIDLDD